MRLRLTRFNKIGLVFFAALILSSGLIWLFEERFNKDQWRADPSNRHRMVDDLIEQRLLIGKTKDETLFILGTPSETLSLEKDIFLYRLGKVPSFFKEEQQQLLIAFDDDKVVKVALTKEE